MYLSFLILYNENVFRLPFMRYQLPAEQFNIEPETKENELTEEEKKRIDEALETERISEYRSDYGRPISQSDLIVINKVSEILDKMPLVNFEPTAVPAIKLHLYNFLKQHPDASENELTREINGCKRWSELEKEYSEEGNPLPTIGIEIEILKENLTSDKVAALDELGIPNYEEPVSTRIWEVNSDFSYSAWMQSRIIQELAAMGALPLEESADSRHRRVPPQRILSLHINLGLPAGITNNIMQRHRPDIEMLSDTLNYAFTSLRRLMRRPVAAYYPLQLGKKSKKFRKMVSAEISEDNDEHFRLELKAPEFRNYPSYRMLAETQRVGAMLFSYIKETEGLSLNTTEQRLAILWHDFSGEVAWQRSEYGLPSNAIDKDDRSRTEVVLNIANSDLRKTSREIFSRYAKKVGEIIKRPE